jgi:hypothetical protein
MNKRSFFKLLAGATAAAAMEVCGLLPVRKAEVLVAGFDPSNPAAYIGEMHWVNCHRVKSEALAQWWGGLIARNPLPEGMGNTIKTIKSSHNSQNEAI